MCFLLPSLPPFTLALPCSCTSAVGGLSLSGGLESSRPTCPSYPPPGLPALVHLRMGCTFHSWFVVLPILGAFTHRLGQTLAGVGLGPNVGILEHNEFVILVVFLASLGGPTPRGLAALVKL